MEIEPPSSPPPSASPRPRSRSPRSPPPPPPPAPPKPAQANVRLSDLNEFISCPVCHGYLIDATTVSECLHTFCKSCIVKHIKSDNNECPKCNTIIHERRPLDYIVHDRNKQDIVYKLVPQLYISEMNRKLGSSSASDQELQELDSNTRIGLKKKFIYVALVHQRRKHFTLIDMSGPHPDRVASAAQQTSDDSSLNHIYLRCPVNVRVGQIRKLLAVKFQLEADDRLALLYKGDIISDNDQISNLAQSVSFVIHYEISKIYPTIGHSDPGASTSSSTISNRSSDIDKMSVDELN